MRKVSLLVIYILSILLTNDLIAHEIKPGYLDVTENSSLHYQVLWKTPVKKGRPLAVLPLFPDDCPAQAGKSNITTTGALTKQWTLSCKNSLQGRSIQMKGLDATLSDVLVRFQPFEGNDQTLRATPESPDVEFQIEQTVWKVAQTYLILGVEHILFGIDHLLFVLALLFLITGVKRLIATITAFTVAHSLTLIGTSLGWFSLPIAPVEAVIALSIVFLAHELAMKTDKSERLSEKKPWLVAFAFGLLHGFGFAGALSNIGLPDNNIPLALLSFNVGVEIGQLLFISVMLVLLVFINKLEWRWQTEKLASYLIGVSGTFWMFERLL